MKNKFLVVASTLFLSATSFAADLPRAAMPTKSVMSPAPVLAWEGAYVGGHFGYGFRGNGALRPGSATEQTVAAVNGLFGGVQAGYLWQTGAFVYGLQGDYSLSNIRGNHNSNDSQTIRMPSFGSVNARIGYAFTQNYLGYALAGAAMGKVDVIGPAPTSSQSFTAPQFGLGGEYKFTRNMSAFAEGRYTKWGKNDNVSLDNITGRVGVNYRF